MPANKREHHRKTNASLQMSAEHKASTASVLLPSPGFRFMNERFQENYWKFQNLKSTLPAHNISYMSVSQQKIDKQ